MLAKIVEAITPSDQTAGLDEDGYWQSPLRNPNLSKATSILSKFISVDTGVSQAVCSYIRRASVSVNELNQLHKEHKLHCKQKITKSETITEDEKLNQSVISNQQLLSHSELSRELGYAVSNGVESERKKHKKMKRKSGKIEEGRQINSEESQSKKKKRRKSEGQSQLNFLM